MTNDQTPSGETGVVGQGQTDTGKPAGTGENAKTPKKVNFKKKFAASTREAQRLAKVAADSQSELAVERANRARAEQMAKDWEERFKSDRPDEYDAVKTNEQLKEQNRRLAEMSENQALDSFIRSNKEAKPFKDALSSLKKAFPDKSYKVLFDANFSSVAEKRKSKKLMKKARKNAPERGGMTGEPGRSDTPSDFNSWPVAKRKAWFKQHGY